MKMNDWRKKLKELREKSNLTQEELSIKTGVSQAQISQLESGKRNFTQKTIDPILEYYGLNYNDIFIETDQNQLVEYLEDKVEKLTEKNKDLKDEIKKSEKENRILKMQRKNLLESVNKIINKSDASKSIKECRQCRQEFKKFFNNFDFDKNNT